MIPNGISGRHDEKPKVDPVPFLVTGPMQRASKLLFFVGIFLVVSVLWPYDPDANISSSAVRPLFAPAVFVSEPISTLPVPDYWLDETQKLILQGSGFLRTHKSIEGWQEFAVPANTLVPPGTDYLLVTPTARTPDGTPPSFELIFLSANEEYRHVPLLMDRPNKVDINEEMNDWAQDPNTRWQFWLANNIYSPTDVSIRIDAVRVSGPLPDRLEYEDRWGEDTVVRVYDQKGGLFDARITPSNRNPAVLLDTPSERPTMQLVPAMSVDELRVVLEYNSSTPSQLHYRPTLSYRGADLERTWEGQGVPPNVFERQSHGRFEWSLPVEPRMWDSPFALKTRWDVIINWRGESSDPPTMMEGDYHFWIEVHKARAATE